MTFEEFYKSVENYKRLRPVIFKLEHDDKSVGDQQIFDAEKEYGIVFPDSYKCILKSIGGGYFGYTVMYSLDDEGFFNIRNHVTGFIWDGTNCHLLCEEKTAWIFR